jgi:pyruvate dehydrogenase E1 component alpha subunit
MTNNHTTLVSAYENMLLMRRFEEKAAQLYTMGLICGFCHLYIGQEAIAATLQSVLTAKDSFITSYRCHGPMLARGGDPKAIMAELLGKEDGCSGGRGGSMHMFDTAHQFYGGHGIVGAQVPIGTGLAFAEKYKGSNNICVTLFGDGATNQGQVYEAFNMAKLWELPVLYVIENNLYALGTSLKRSTGETNLYKRGLAFSIPGKQVDGMDFISLYKEVQKAADYVRTKQSPFILEAMTYRYRGHSMSDPAHYRSKAEVEHYKNKDPITGMKKHLLKNNIATEAALQKIEQKIKTIVQEAVDFAKASKEPELNTLFDNIKSEN